MNVRDTLDLQLNVFADFQPKLPEGILRYRNLMFGTNFYNSHTFLLPYFKFSSL